VVRERNLMPVNSSPEHRQTVLRFGRALAQEENYLFPVGFPALRQWRGWFFVDGPTRPIGVAIFERRTDGWWALWTYVEPRYRRQGIASRAWSQIEKELGGFKLEGPVSEGGRALITKHGRRLDEDADVFRPESV
jgi:GNAT superfamily N-acetyltransferase